MSITTDSFNPFGKVMPISLGKVISSMSCDQRTLLSKTPPAEMGGQQRPKPPMFSVVCFSFAYFWPPIYFDFPVRRWWREGPHC